MSPISSVGLLPPIHSIPNEILYLITSHLPLSSLPALVLVNHRLNTLCTPELYTPVPATAGLRYAATSGSVVVARIFIERYGVEPNTRFREDKTEGMTALHVAASRGHEELVAYLLAAGSGVEERNEAKRSPLHCAAHSGRLGAARLLVEAGADVGGRDETEGTALHGAAKVCVFPVCCHADY